MGSSGGAGREVRLETPTQLVLRGVLGLVGAAGIVAWVIGRSESVWGIAGAAIAFASFSLMGLLRPRRLAGTIAAGAEGLRVDGQVVVPQEVLRSGTILTEKERTFVRLETANGAVEVDVDDSDAGQALLRELALDALHRTTRLAAVGFLGLPVAVVVGADGLRIERTLRPARFVPHEAIRAVEIQDARVTLHLHRGEPVALGFGPTSGRNASELGRREALAAHRCIQAAREANRQAEPANVPAAALARTARGTADWLRALRTMGVAASEGTFRSAPLRREELFRVLESPHGGHVEKVGAAIALASGLGDEEKPRLRIAIERTADAAHRERLRVATTSQDEAELARALEEAEEADGVSRVSAPH
jgi:hypothetical protein